MIARISTALLLVGCALSLVMKGEVQTKAGRKEPVVIQAPQEAWLTKDQASHILTSIEMLVRQVQELSKQNKAPRPDAPGVCDPSYPGCGMVDLSGVLGSLCIIENQLVCICERLLTQQSGLASCCEVIGACTDASVLFGSQVDKSCIDAQCLTVVSLLKTILLELRGNFTDPFPCSVTP